MSWAFRYLRRRVIDVEGLLGLIAQCTHREQWICQGVRAASGGTGAMVRRDQSVRGPGRWTVAGVGRVAQRRHIRGWFHEAVPTAWGCNER